MMSLIVCDAFFFFLMSSPPQGQMPGPVLLSRYRLMQFVDVAKAVR